ncbi:MAG: NDP-sugar synthase [Candidatus Nanopelagicales bacterium]
MTQAILLVGGAGTRLRPLTLTTPKPMLPVAGQPITEHQIRRARAAGVDRVVLGTAYRAEVFSERFGSGEPFGVDIAYAHETTPLGTAGAIRNAAMMLTAGPDDPIVVFNGDIINGLDIAGLVDEHVRTGAAVTLHLTRVSDPRRYGLVPTDDTGRVQAFLEKPESDDQIVTDQINAGCYVFRRSIIDLIAPDRPVSVERETFPELLRMDALVRGVVDDSYWLDLGTPADYVQGSVDLVTGRAPGAQTTAGAQSLIVDVTSVDSSAVVRGGTALDAGVVVESGAIVDASVVMSGVHIGAGARVTKSAIGLGVRIESGAVVTQAVIGDGAIIGARTVVASGARIEPGAVIASDSQID